MLWVGSEIWTQKNPDFGHLLYDSSQKVLHDKNKKGVDGVPDPEQADQQARAGIERQSWPGTA